MLKQKNQENLHLSVAPAIPSRNRSGVVELVGREPLMFAKVENGVTKSCRIFRRKITEKRNFGPNFPQNRLLFARVEIGVTDLSDKKSLSRTKPSTH